MENSTYLQLSRTSLFQRDNDYTNEIVIASHIRDDELRKVKSMYDELNDWKKKKRATERERDRDRDRYISVRLFAYTREWSSLIMSTIVTDEIHDRCSTILPSFMSMDSQHDSGYFTFVLSSPRSPTISMIVQDQYDSPASSDHKHSSPVSCSSRMCRSSIDYEYYRTKRKHRNILSQLLQCNAYHLIDEILKNLAKIDVDNCSKVCQSWQSIINGYYHRQQRYSVKRNLFEINETHSCVRQKKLTSTPMQTITNMTHSNIRVPYDRDFCDTKTSSILVHDQTDSFINTDVHLAASTLSFRYGYLKYLHGPTVPKRCPICAFVSIVDVNDQHGYVL
jgi:hypothetical protein